METRTQPSFVSLLNPVLPVATLWRHRELLWQFTVRNLELRHKGSMLGVAWAVLNPLLMLALYVFVFGFVFKGSFGVPDESRWEFGLGIFLGLTFFHLLAETIAAAPNVISGQPNFVKKVVFPLEILPAANVGAATVHMLITLTMLIAGVLLGGGALTWSSLWLVAIIPPVVAVAFGASWLISAFGVFFRDIGQLVAAFATGLMFASAIFYPASAVQGIPAAWAVLRFNPLIHAVEMARDVVLWHRPIMLDSLVWLYALGLFTVATGYACFMRLKRAFADVI
jgi:lipopolysaccharide transport system permease protein